MNFYKNTFYLTALILVTSLLSCESIDDNPEVAGFTVSDWVGNFAGSEVCTDPEGNTSETTIDMTIGSEGTNVIEVNWVDGAGDTVDFFARLDDTDFGRATTVGFPTGGTNFIIDIVLELGSDANSIVLTADFSGIVVQNCVMTLTRQ